MRLIHKYKETVMQKLIGLITLLGFSSPVNASDNFVVSTKIYNSEHLVSSPTLTVSPKEEALISVDNLYSFALKLTPEGESTVNLSTKLEVGGESISPSLVVELDQEAKISVGNTALSVIVKKL